jgi:phage terminase small subunit
MSVKTFTLRKRAFAAEYMVDRNKGKAALRAGYAKHSARVTGQKLYAEPLVRAEIDRLEAELQELNRMTIEKTVARLTQIAMADPNELMSTEVIPCRYCYGKKHKFQWRTPEEFKEACEAWASLPEGKREHIAEPKNKGGFGYRGRGEASIDCPSCDGRGVPLVVLHDTTHLSPAGLALYAGVKQTQHGIEVKTADQSHALEALCRYLGVFNGERKPGDQLIENFTAFLQGIGKAGSPPAFGDKRFEDDEADQ